MPIVTIRPVQIAMPDGEAYFEVTYDASGGTDPETGELLFVGPLISGEVVNTTQTSTIFISIQRGNGAHLVKRSLLPGETQIIPIGGQVKNAEDIPWYGIGVGEDS